MSVTEGRMSPPVTGTSCCSGLHDGQLATRSPAVSADRRPFASPSEVLPSTKKQRSDQFDVHTTRQLGLLPLTVLCRAGPFG